MNKREMLGRLIRPVSILPRQMVSQQIWGWTSRLANSFSSNGQQEPEQTEQLANSIRKVAAPNAVDIDFVDRDFQEMKAQDLRLQYDKAYLKIMDAWQKPLEKKKKRQARIAEIKAAFVDQDSHPGTPSRTTGEVCDPQP